MENRLPKGSLFALLFLCAALLAAMPLTALAQAPQSIPLLASASGTPLGAADAADLSRLLAEEEAHPARHPSLDSVMLALGFLSVLYFLNRRYSH